MCRSVILSTSRIGFVLSWLILLQTCFPFVAEWDFGGFPPWLLATKPALRLRSSDPGFLLLVCFPILLLVECWKFHGNDAFKITCFLLFSYSSRFLLFKCSSLLCPMFKVERWWGSLLPTIAPYLYGNGGPIIMVQVCK